jgi:hypothetical protein
MLMERFEHDELTDSELDQLLAQWQTPLAPEGMRSALFGPQRPWYARLWSASIRIPLPAALALLLVLGFFVVEMRRAASISPPAAVQSPTLGFRELHPVAELKPRIIKGQNADN